MKTEVDDGLTNESCQQPDVGHAGVEEDVLGEQKDSLETGYVVGGYVGDVLHRLAHEETSQSVGFFLLGSGGCGKGKGHDDADDVAVTRRGLARA